MKQETNKLPITLTNIPAIIERLKMQQKEIPKDLANFSSVANGGDDKTNDPYFKYGQRIGGFVSKISTNAVFNPNNEKETKPATASANIN